MKKKIIPLTNVPIGKVAVVRDLLLTGSIRRRLQDIGVINGTAIECLQKSPAGDPIAYLIRGAVIAIRSEESSKILVELDSSNK